MAYSDFSLSEALVRFSLTAKTDNLFPMLFSVAPTAWLTETLERSKGFALYTEKARSEFVIAPVLLTVRELSQNRISLLSGEPFDVDIATGLCGVCDFVLTDDVPIPIIRNPVFLLVSPKDGDIQLGLGRCVAQMVGASRFNAQSGKNHAVFGCVTTGELWQFLRLSDTILTVDEDRRHIGRIGEVLAAFLTAINETASLNTK